MKDFAVIVDLNGTLLDTEIPFFYAYKEMLAEYDISFTREKFTEHWSTKGKKLKDFLIEIKREDLRPIENEMLSEKNKIFHDILKEKAILMAGAKEFLLNLKQSGIKIGLDSSSTMDNIQIMLKHFDLDDMIDEISSGDMKIDEKKYGERKKKSSRLKALADMLEYKCEDCIVIGDAEKDIKGAKEARMKGIAVPNQYTKNNDFSLADNIVKSLKDITPQLLSSL